MTPPTVTNLQRFGVHLEPTTIVLTFSEPMDANRAGTLANYTLVATSHGRDRVIRLLVANYDAVARTVTLVPSQSLNLHLVYRLTVNGRSPNGLTNTSGVLLDGNGDGNPGGNYVADLWGFGFDKPHVPSNKLILRDQLQAASRSPSRRVQAHQSSKSLLQYNHPKAVFQTPQHSLTVSTPHGPFHALRTRRHPSEGSLGADRRRRVLPLAFDYVRSEE